MTWKETQDAMFLKLLGEGWEFSVGFARGKWNARIWRDRGDEWSGKPPRSPYREIYIAEGASADDALRKVIEKRHKITQEHPRDERLR